MSMNPHLPYRRTAACSHVGEEPLLYYHDWQVLEQCDGVKPGSAIGAALGISETAVIQSLERLMENGLVRAEPVSYSEFWHASQNQKGQSSAREKLEAMEAMVTGLASTIAGSLAQLEQSLLTALEKMHPPPTQPPLPIASHPPQAHPHPAALDTDSTSGTPPPVVSVTPLPPRQGVVKPTLIPSRAGVTSIRPASPSGVAQAGFSPSAQRAQAAASPNMTGDTILSVPESPATSSFPAEGQKLKPLVDAIVAKAGGGTKGQLAVYRVFLKVPSDMLKAAGVGKLSLIDQNATIKDAELWDTILRATQEVAGLEYPR